MFFHDRPDHAPREQAPDRADYDLQYWLELHRLRSDDRGLAADGAQICGRLGSEADRRVSGK